MRTVRGYAPIVALAFIAFIAFTLGNSFRQAMVIVSVLGWTAVVALAVYMVLFRGMRFSIFGSGEEPPVEAGVAQFDVEPEVVVVAPLSAAEADRIGIETR
jgi:hypothetical protein